MLGDLMAFQGSSGKLILGLDGDTSVSSIVAAVSNCVTARKRGDSTQNGKARQKKVSMKLVM
jgi:hypothetical protein